MGEKKDPWKGTMKTVCGYTEKEGEDQQQDPSARGWGMLTVSAVSIPGRTGDTEKEKRRGGNMLYSLQGIQHIFSAGNEKGFLKIQRFDSENQNHGLPERRQALLKAPEGVSKAGKGRGRP